jgi:hypothetical protein
MEYIRPITLLALVFFLRATQRPLLTASLYVAILLGMAAYTHRLEGSLEPLLVRGAVATAWFWLLHRFEDKKWFYTLLLFAIVVI